MKAASPSTTRQRLRFRSAVIVSVDVAALVMIGDTLATDRFEVPRGHAKLYGQTDAGPMLELALRALTDF